MGVYWNPDNDSFRKDSRSKIYVDKTGLIGILNDRINTSGNCIALSHARRFGKSQAAGMIDAYYSCGSDSRELFSHFMIASAPDFAVHLNQYNVIHLDISSFADEYQGDLTEQIRRNLYDEMKEQFPAVDYSRPIGKILSEVYKQSGRPFVIIIDEWDCIIRNRADHPEEVHHYLQFLHSLFKSEESKRFLALAYITGILPLKKIRDESALNNFREYTMLDSKNLTPFFGFTETEVRSLCHAYHMDFESVKKWYDGYRINGIHIYNPNSVIQAMEERSLKSYWKNTSAFDTINTYITRNYPGLKDDILTMLSGGSVRVDTGTFQNDLSIIESKDDALTALIHLGYLGYEEKSRKAFIPNFEVATAYQAALKKSGWTEVAKAISRCDDLLDATIEGDADLVAELIEEAHEAYTSVLKYNDENSLSCVLTMAYFTAPAYYNVIRELPSGKGFADLAFLPRQDIENHPAILVELKYDKDADTAIRQIKERRYAGALQGYPDGILLVGISYQKDGKDKKHSCKIEKLL